MVKNPPAVIGIPDEKWGEAVKAFVVARPGATVDVEALIAEVNGARDPTTRRSPSRSSTTPVTGVGKVDKKVHARRYWAGSERSVN